ncbi:MAG: MlaE family ABC transporter permease [Pseudomonadota bacterium]|uniref:MlaE family ABC transporter permease n=1 Tax=Thermithiobacillus tepidarius TaxID=929 RepID=UPI0004102B16|nr:ABC transporter permease [Thermithiobacillus tepidarius]
MNAEANPTHPRPPGWQMIQDSPSPGAARLLLHGAWNLQGIGRHMQQLRSELGRLAGQNRLDWDLRAVDALDTAGALLLWRAWGARLPSRTELSSEQRAIFERLEALPALPPPASQPLNWRLPLEAVGRTAMRIGRQGVDALALLGYFLLDLLHVLRRPGLMPWRETSATLYKSGPQALGIIGLVGFSIGVVVSYQSALTLAAYGANIYIVNLLGLSILRELGPLMAAVILAGRSGSAFTAQLGVMRVTQEIDALETFGVSPTLRLILPKVVALALALPLLVLWADAIAILGGMIIAKYQLGIGYPVFLARLPQVVPQVNFWIGIGKGVLFGAIIALVASFYGLKTKPNTESLSRETTNSVVMSVTLVILIDALIAFLLSDVGL